MNDENKNSVLSDSDANTKSDVRLDLLYEIGRILASQETMDAAGTLILRAVCRGLQFDLGELWRLSEDETVLRLESVWHSPSARLEKFAADSRRFRFAVGIGLPGRVWAQNAPVWMENLSGEDEKPRRRLVAESGLQNGFAFPIRLDKQFLGAFSFFSAEPRRVNDDLLQMFAAVGENIGQFIKRERAESHLRASEDRYRAFIKQSTEGIWRFELDEKFSVDLPIEKQVKLAFERGYLAECNDAMARMYDLERAEDLMGSRVADLLDASNAANVEYLRSFVESGYHLIDAESHEKDRHGRDKHFLNSLIGTIENRRLVRVWGTQRDITEQKKAEQLLADNEERYRALVEATSTVVWRANENGELNFVGSTWKKVSGQRIEEILGSGWLDALHPDDRAPTIRVWQNALRAKSIYETEFRVLTSGGGYRWFAARAVPILNADGSLREWVGANTDINERKAAEEKMRESEARLHLAVDISRVSTFDIDLATDAVQTDAVGREIYGFETDEPLTFAKIQARFHPEDRDEVARRVAEAFALDGSDEFEVEQRIVRTNGETRWIRVRGRAFFSGEGESRRAVYCLGTYIDITAGKRGEEALLERERLALLNAEVSRALIRDDSLPNILKLCTEAVVRHLDAAFARVWTLDTETDTLELQASSGIYTHLDGAHSRISVGKFKIGLIAAERQPHLTNSVVGDARVADQEWAINEKMKAFAGYPLLVEDRLVGVVAMFARQPLTDKTIEALAVAANAVALGIERKQTENEREQLLASEQRAREIAEEANHAKDEFIAVVSHELRSPLNAMLGWTRILQSQNPDEQTKKAALDIIVRNARSQSRLIEDLLDIARISNGKLRLEMQPTELIPIVIHAIEIIKPTAESRRINLTQTFDRAANMIDGDIERLQQVFENLLSNAVKFTAPGGSVRIRLKRENDRGKITISDTGQGISREFLPQIFERFKQADPSATRRHGGLGIGLSLARDLIELHGGAISAESAGEGKGATFTVTLPLRAVAPAAENIKRGETMNAQGKLSGFWILAVDDEADARELVSFMLQINGAKVTTANSAVEALDILKSSVGRLPDILLSDISMPNESGYALLEKIRALPEEHGGQIPAVALTAFSRPEDRAAAYEAGFQKHLGKPVEPDDLISAIIETAGAR